MRKLIYILTLAGCLLCVACQRTKPQAPANRTEAADSAQLAMVFFYQRMAEEADRSLAQTVQTSGQPYTLHNTGFWYRITRRTELPHLQKGQLVTLCMKVYTLQDTLLLDTQESIEVEKRQIVKAVDSFLPEMRMDESAVLLVPWYCAYGQTGTGEIPPYENVKIKIEVKHNY